MPIKPHSLKVGMPVAPITGVKAITARVAVAVDEGDPGRNNVAVLAFGPGVLAVTETENVHVVLAGKLILLALKLLGPENVAPAVQPVPPTATAGPIGDVKPAGNGSLKLKFVCGTVDELLMETVMAAVPPTAMLVGANDLEMLTENPPACAAGANAERPSKRAQGSHCRNLRNNEIMEILPVD